ncbi:MAG: mannitol dehydrogenase family protein, partial [Rhodobacteraceae bacterium]|nr:mannitol dehydrogenase family protein [Paracoccaceae bacterium]
CVGFAMADSFEQLALFRFLLGFLADPARPASAIGFITRALAARRGSGGKAFTVLSCDNIPENGKLLRGLVLELAAQIDPGLADWISAEGAFPSSMVDRIVPATTAEDIITTTALTGFRDEAPVMHEPFRQWVVEDTFVGGLRPDLGAVGVELVSDVTPYEHMKLRCLNGTHSSLAYIGYLAGAETISEAVSRPALAAYAKHLWQNEIIPVLSPPPGADLGQYADALFARYANTGIQHRTWQIAMDGSQKLPQRLLGTISENLAAGRVPSGLILAVAGWIQYTSGHGLDSAAIDVRDPLAERLAACWAESASGTVASYLALRQVFSPALAGNAVFVAALVEALETLQARGAEASAAEVAAIG